MNVLSVRGLEVCLAACLTATVWAQPADDAANSIRRAIDLRRQDQPEKALECLRQAIHQDPQSLRAHAEYIRTMTYSLDRLDLVKAEYEALMRKEPGNPVYPMALASGQWLTTEAGKQGWYESVARSAPESSWGLLAKARLTLEHDPKAAAERCQRALERDPSLQDAYTLGIFLHEGVLHDLDGALELAARLAGQSAPELRAAGLYQQWRLRLLRSQDSAEAIAQVRQDLRQLTASGHEIEVLTAVRTAYTTLLKDSAGGKAVEAAIRRIDRAWYPDRGSEMYFSFSNESGRLRQIVAVNHESEMVHAVFAVNHELPVEERMASLRSLLPKISTSGVRMLAYRDLFRAAEESRDVAAIIESGEKYREAAQAFDAAETDPALLAKIAIARSEVSSDLPRATEYAFGAYEATAAIQPWTAPRNTDESWLQHQDSKASQSVYQMTRALALEAHGWTLCVSGHCEEGEPLIRQAVQLRRNEGNLRHLAKALERVGRQAEAAEISAQAENEWLDSLKRQFRKDPSKDFELTTVDGSAIRLSSLKGKVVMVNFWATWCSPCVQEMPLLAELYDKYRDQGFEILAVSVDEDAARYRVAAFARDHGLKFPVAYDRGAKDLYHAASYPTSLLIDRDGMVRLRMGLAERRSLDAVLAELLK